jgi:hypothetical protein
MSFLRTLGTREILRVTVNPSSPISFAWHLSCEHVLTVARRPRLAQTHAICPTCKAESASKSPTERQFDASRRLHRSRKKKGLCERCTKPVAPDRNYCAEHLATLREAERKRRERRLASGLCALCIQPSAEGYTKCATHLEKQRARSKIRTRTVTSTPEVQCTTLEEACPDPSANTRTK